MRRRGILEGSARPFDLRYRALGHLALAAVGEKLRRLGEREPARLVHLDRELRVDRTQPAPLRADEEEAHDLEDPLAVPRVDVLHVAELRDHGALDPGLLL